MVAKHQSGFTLIELLIALLLFGMLCAALFAALRLGAGTVDRILLRQNDSSGLSSAQAVLDRTIAAAYPEYVPASADGTPGHADFDGEAEAISFLAPAPAAIAPGGLARIRIWIAGSGAARRLQIAAVPELAWPGTPPVVETLVSPLAGAHFAYWGADAAGAAPYWHGSWRDRPVLPRLIRISIFTGRGAWPDLLVAPLIRTDQACRFVTLTQSCLGR